ncbi:MAG: S1/P1 nuclease [Acidobacteriota bacterium]|nr:S1/P1 nuclease [Acidobacteriota bacterium]
MLRQRSIRKAAASVALALSLIAMTPARAAAWGGKGHAVVAHIALRLLTGQTAGVVKGLLAEKETLESVAPWADSLRGSFKEPGARPETARWHFIDIPRAKDYDAERDCPFLLNGPCAIEALFGVEQVLADPSKGYYGNSRYEALKYAVHIVGDLHQPLHCIDDDDAGGNRKDVLWTDGQPWKLHGVWDSGILNENIARAKKEDPNFSQTHDDAIDYAEHLLKTMSPEMKKFAAGESEPKSAGASVVERPEIVRWARESHKIAQRAYDDLPAPKEGRYDLSDGTYYNKHRADVDLQLIRAGVRLARVLNESLRK